MKSDCEGIKLRKNKLVEESIYVEVSEKVIFVCISRLLKKKFMWESMFIPTRWELSWEGGGKSSAWRMPMPSKTLRTQKISYLGWLIILELILWCVRAVAFVLSDQNNSKYPCEHIEPAPTNWCYNQIFFCNSAERQSVLLHLLSGLRAEHGESVAGWI